MIAAAMIVLSALVGQIEAGQSAFHRGIVDTDPAVDAIVTRASQSALDYYRRQNHLNTPADVRAVYDPGTGMIRIDLRGGRLPESGGAELEDLQGFISNGALDAMRPISPATGTKFFYNGRSFEEQYPAEAAEDRNTSRLRQEVGPAVVSAGHGWYYHDGFSEAG